MKTIRITAINTEKARSRTHERALHTLVRTDKGDGASSGTGLGVEFSCILCYAIIDALSGRSVATSCYFSREPSTGMGTAPSLSARSLKSARLKALPFAFLYSSRALIQARQPT